MLFLSLLSSAQVGACFFFFLSLYIFFFLSLSLSLSLSLLRLRRHREDWHGPCARMTRTNWEVYHAWPLDPVS